MSSTGKPMETKRTHTKSRRGCLACKARKVKCDEKHPLCGNCARKFPGRTKCDYDITFVRATAHEKITPAPNPSSSSQIGAPSPRGGASSVSGSNAVAPSPSRTVAQRSLELRIWHHFLTVTSLTLPPPNRRDIQSLWTEDVPQWAFEYDFLLDALLGLTAIHMYILKTPDPNLLSCAYTYYAEAASKYRKALSDINGDTAGPILATSLFIGFQSKIVPRLHAANEPYKLPIGLFYLQRGVPTTYKAVAPFLQGHRMMAILFSTMPPVEEVPSCDSDEFLPDEVYQDAQNLLRQIDATDAMTLEAKKTCRETFAFVLAIHRSLEKDEPDMFTRRRVTAFFQIVPWAFVELLEHKNPIAMLILARYFAVSKVRDDLWWVRGLAEREILGIVGILPQEWRSYMDFPLKLLNGISSPPGSVQMMPGSRSTTASTASMSPNMENRSLFSRPGVQPLMGGGGVQVPGGGFGTIIGRGESVPPGVNANYEKLKNQYGQFRDMNRIPRFEDLPLGNDDPPYSAWGLYGPHDQLGFLNRLTNDVVVEAAKEIRIGLRISLDWPLDAQTNPGFGRPAFEHQIIHKGPRVVNDDVWKLNSQSSSQWDGLRHFAYQDAGLFYNGVTLDAILSSGDPRNPPIAGVNGIHFWAERGIVGRGVLLDFAAWRDHVLAAATASPESLTAATVSESTLARLRDFDPFESYAIEVSDLRAIADWEGVDFQPADILIVRTGYIAAYGRKTTEELLAANSQNPPHVAGLARGPEMLRFVWENFSAVAGDQPACEVYPVPEGELRLHEVLLSGWGCPIGELWDLETLSRECASQKRYSFFFTSEPCKVTGAVASPPNALAIF